jgi:hypothetical protein
MAFSSGGGMVMAHFSEKRWTGQPGPEAVSWLPFPDSLGTRDAVIVNAGNRKRKGTPVRFLIAGLYFRS